MSASQGRSMLAPMATAVQNQAQPAKPSQLCQQHRATEGELVTGRVVCTGCSADGPFVSVPPLFLLKCGYPTLPS